MATISAVTTFDLSLTPKQFKWLDTTDWAGQSISTANVNGSFKVTAPSGVVIYNNTDYSNSGCDIRINVALTSQQTVSLPITTAGLVESGTYTVLYTVYNSSALVYYTQSYTFNYTYVAALTDILQTADCVSPLFTSKDNTDYTQANASLTLTRSQVLYYPNGSAGQGSPVTTSSQTLITATFYNGPQTTTITSDVTYTFSDGLIVIDVITGSVSITVDCVFICSISCCIKSYESQMWNYQYTNEVLYEEYRAVFSQIMGYVGLIRMCIECGLNTDITGFLNKIKTLAHCTDNCCGSTEFSQVQGIGISALDVAVVSDSSPSLTVTPVIVGSTTTYHVALSDAIIALISNPIATALAEGDNITLDPITVDGNTTTYTVNGLSTTVVSNNDNNVLITNNGTTDGVTEYGISLVPAYAYIYNTATRVVADGSALSFSGAQSSLNVGFTANSSDITIQKAGLYMIDWTVITTR